MSADNTRICLSAVGIEHFRAAFELVLKIRGSRVTHWGLCPERRSLALFWTKPTNSKAAQIELLPYPMDLPTLTSFVEGWLKSADYDEPPHSDGNYVRGFTLATEEWGHVWGSPTGVVEVFAVWCCHGK